MIAQIADVNPEQAESLRFVEVERAEQDAIEDGEQRGSRSDPDAEDQQHRQ